MLPRAVLGDVDAVGEDVVRARRLDGQARARGAAGAGDLLDGVDEVPLRVEVVVLGLALVEVAVVLEDRHRPARGRAEAAEGRERRVDAAEEGRAARGVPRPEVRAIEAARRRARARRQQRLEGVAAGADLRELGGEQAQCLRAVAVGEAGAERERAVLRAVESARRPPAGPADAGGRRRGAWPAHLLRAAVGGALLLPDVGAPARPGLVGLDDEDVRLQVGADRPAVVRDRDAVEVEGALAGPPRPVRLRAHGVPREDVHAWPRAGRGGVIRTSASPFQSRLCVAKGGGGWRENGCAAALGQARRWPPGGRRSR